jgi:hypothetical protein
MRAFSKGRSPFHRRISFGLLHALAKDEERRQRLGAALEEGKNSIPSKPDAMRR